MEQNIENNSNFKNKALNFYRFNKKKVFIFVFIFIAIIITTFYLKYNILKKNILSSENFIKAGVYLSIGKKKDAINLYEEIIFSKNKFYSILALNTLLEKNLISDRNKILDYFNVVEKIKKSKEKSDILKFKKALYLLKQSKFEEGNKLLENLVSEDSKIKLLAKEILSK